MERPGRLSSASLLIKMPFLVDLAEAEVAKYGALARWLRAQQGPTIRVSFDELDRVVGGLPALARSHRAWWANEIEGDTSRPRAG